jgi:predicted enzyme related to lactoylglutathione lyase
MLNLLPPALRRYCLVLPLLLAAPAFAQTPAEKIVYVGSVSINPCQDAKVLADWYAKLGLVTKEYQGGYYCMLTTPAGPMFFGIHPRKADAPKKSSGSVSVVLRCENYAASIAAVKSRGLVPDSTETDPSEGQFAHFHDPDGNEVTLWGK